MTLKEFYRKEKYIALHAQSRRFRIVKYCVLLVVAVGVYAWKGWSAVGLLFLLLFLAGIGLHFFFRWKTEGVDKVLGALQANSFRGGIIWLQCRHLFHRSGLHVLNPPGKNHQQGELK